MPNVFLFALMHTSHHSGVGSGIIEELFHWMLRGFAWSMGSRVAHMIPMWLVIVIAIVVVIWYFTSRKHHDHDDYDR